MEAISTHTAALLALLKRIFFSIFQLGSTAHRRGWGLKSSFSALIFILSMLTLSLNGWGQTSLNMQNTSVYVSSGNFYDDAGSATNYSNNRNLTITFSPAISTMKVRLTFSSFNTQSGYDGLLIYNGNSTSATLISSGAAAGAGASTCPAGAWSGALSGATLPKSSGASDGVVTSTAADGSLTIVFKSDGATRAAGWAASISLTGSPCGGTLVDFGGGSGSYWNGVGDIITLYPATATDKVRLTFTSFETENNYDGMMIYDGNSTAATLISSGQAAGSDATTCPAGAWRGSLSGSTLPKSSGASDGVVTSTAADGSLTIVFKSDGGTVAAGWAATVSCYTPCTNPTISSVTPTNPTTCSGTNGQIVVATSGTVTDYSKDNGTNWTASSSNSYTFSSLAAGSYNIKVRNTASCITTYASNAVVLSDPAAPAAPSAISVGSATCAGTGVTFTQGACTSGCTCYWVSSASGTETTNSNATNTSATTAGSYTMYVRAKHNTTGCWSTAVSASGTVNAAISLTGQPSTSTQTTMLNGTAFSSLSVTATGSSPTYQWYSNTSASNSGGTLISGATSASYTPVCAAAGTLYYYCIVSGTSPCTAVTSNVSGAIKVVGAPGTVSTSNVGCTSLTLNWVAATNGSSYGIHVSTASNFSTNLAGNNCGGVACNGSTDVGNVTTATITGLTQGTTYYIRVRAISGSQYSAWSNLNTTSVATVAAPSAPTAGSASRCGTGTVAITATPGAGETIDWYGATSGGSILTTGTPNPAQGTTSFTTPSISSNQTYYAEARNTTTGCVSSTRTAVVATVNSAPTVTIAVSESSGTANDGTLCASGASATLTASGASNYTWTGGPSTAANAITPSTTTAYTVTGTSAAGCTATNSTTITVLNITTYYSKSTGNLDVLTNWGSNSDGTGCSPANFTTNGITYIIQNNLSPTTSVSGWTVSGTGSIVKVGNASSAVTFTAGGNLSFSCDLEITANATLNLNDKNMTLTGDFVRSASTAAFNAGGTNSIVTFSGGSNQFVNVTAVDTGNPAASDISFNDVTVTGTDVRMYYDNANNRKINIRNLTVQNSDSVLKFFSNP
jgi:hypothetical protein